MSNIQTLIATLSMLATLQLVLLIIEFSYQGLFILGFQLTVITILINKINKYD